MKVEEILHARLHNQLISNHSARTPAEIISGMVAIQAQDYLGAKWSIGLRYPGLKDSDIDQAIISKSIIRTWPMRGTLHFVSAIDARWMLRLLTPRIISGSAGRHRQLELDEVTLNKSMDLLIQAMEGGKQLMRNEVYQILEDNGIPTTGQRGIHIINYLAQKQILCHGVHNEKQATYTLFDEWITESKNIEGEEALAELAYRYFAGHGPATINDFIWWTGLKISDAKNGLNAVKDRLQSFEVNKKIYWTSTNLPDQVKKNSAYLLPGFDEYMLGYADRSLSLDPMFSNRIVPGNNGVFMPTIVINGKVEGTWKRILKTDKVVIEIFSFYKLTASKIKSITTEAKKYGSFLDKNATLEVR
ncbi:winged helix DNA-binding domain-containing protein [Dyadobacter bucti]|uniref:winged helix DNA-binding domain-containing protein n=1 Tax=Dyadobacter bucti TaxID=2572203 RepID=UPI003F6F3EA3